MNQFKRLKQITLEDGIFFVLLVFALGSSISGHLGKNSEIVAIALCAIRLLRGNIPMERVRVVKHLLLVYGLFYGTMAFSALRTGNFALAIKGHPVMSWAFEALLILCVALFVRQKRQVWILWAALFLSLLVVDFRLLYEVARGAVRPSGFLKNVLADNIIYAVLVPPLAALSVDMELGKRERNICRGMFALGLAGAYVTGTRGIWISILLTLPLMFAFRGGWKQSLRCMSVCVLCVFALVLLAPSHIRDRLSPARLGQDASVLARLAMLESATHIFLEHPVLGVGMGKFNEYWKEQCPPNRPSWKGFVNPHNSCLTYLSEGGLVGFAGYITMIGYLLWWAWRRRGTRHGILLFGAVFSAFLKGMTESEFCAHQGVRVFWLIIGLAFAAEAIALEEGKTGDMRDKNPVDRRA